MNTTALFLGGTLILGALMIALVIVLWVRLSKISTFAQQAQEELERQKRELEMQVKTVPQKSQELLQDIQQSKPQTKEVKLPKPNVSSDARIENLSYTYNSIPGVLGAAIADRFGQPVAIDSDLVLDKNFIAAHMVEIYSMARKEKLSIGRLKNIILMGEGSYWILSDLVGMHLGLWFEKDVPIGAALELFEDFKFRLANSLKNYYTKIW